MHASGTPPKLLAGLKRGLNDAFSFAARLEARTKACKGAVPPRRLSEGVSSIGKRRGTDSGPSFGSETLNGPQPWPQRSAAPHNVQVLGYTASHYPLSIPTLCHAYHVNPRDGSNCIFYSSAHVIC